MMTDREVEGSFTRALRLIAFCTGLSSLEKTVLNALMWHRNKETFLCYPSLKRLSEETGISLASLKRCRKSLQRKGLIDFIPGRGLKHPSHYKIVLLDGNKREREKVWRFLLTYQVPENMREINQKGSERTLFHEMSSDSDESTREVGENSVRGEEEGLKQDAKRGQREPLKGVKTGHEKGSERTPNTQIEYSSGIHPESAPSRRKAPDSFPSPKEVSSEKSPRSSEELDPEEIRRRARAWRTDRERRKHYLRFCPEWALEFERTPDGFIKFDPAFIEDETSDMQFFCKDAAEKSVDELKEMKWIPFEEMYVIQGVLLWLARDRPGLNSQLEGAFKKESGWYTWCRDKIAELESWDPESRKEIDRIADLLLADVNKWDDRGRISE